MHSDTLYYRVTPDNLEEIRKLAKNRGRLLIGEAGPNSFTSFYAQSQGRLPEINDFFMHLFYNPNFDEENLFFDASLSERYSREYLLRPIRTRFADSLSKAYHESLQRLETGDCELIITRQSVVGRGVFGNDGISLFIPEEKGLKQAMATCLDWMTAGFNETTRKFKKNRAELNDEDRKRILDYIYRDIDKGNIVRANTQAGIIADTWFS